MSNQFKNDPGEEGFELKECLEGKVLVASPHLEDPYFEKSLVYICAHDAGGVIGVILNHPIGQLSAEELFQGYDKSDGKDIKMLSSMTKKSYPILFGGPTNGDILVALSITKEQEKVFADKNKVNLHIDASSLVRDIAKSKLKVSKCLFAKGVSAWDTAQLEQELLEDNWFVIEPTIDLIFSQKPKDKWEEIVHKKLGITDLSCFVCYSGNA